MVILQIEVVEFAFSAVDVERQSQIASDAQAPNALSIAAQRVGFPRGQRTQFRGTLHVVEKGQHLAKFVDRIGGNPFPRVIGVKRLETFMEKASYLHLTDCSP